MYIFRILFLVIAITSICSNSLAQTATDYNEYAKLKLDSGEYVESIIACDMAIQKNPDTKIAYFTRGMANYALKQDKPAVSDLTVFLKKYPEAYLLLYFRGKSKFRLGDYRGAVSDLEKYSRLYQDGLTSECFIMLAKSRSFLYDYTPAIRDYTSAIKLDSESSEAFYGRGLCKMILKQKNSACMDFSRAGELGYEKAYTIIRDYCN